MSQEKYWERKQALHCVSISLLAIGVISLLVLTARAPASAAQETAGGKPELLQMEEQLFSLSKTERRDQEL